jgi:hypothetical protein
MLSLKIVNMQTNPTNNHALMSFCKSMVLIMAKIKGTATITPINMSGFVVNIPIGFTIDKRINSMI